MDELSLRNALASTHQECQELPDLCTLNGEVILRLDLMRSNDPPRRLLKKLRFVVTGSRTVDDRYIIGQRAELVRPFRILEADARKVSALYLEPPAARISDRYNGEDGLSVTLHGKRGDRTAEMIADSFRAWCEHLGADFVKWMDCGIIWAIVKRGSVDAAEIARHSFVRQVRAPEQVRLASASGAI